MNRYFAWLACPCFVAQSAMSDLRKPIAGVQSKGKTPQV
jgi:hypothetical protein